MVYTYTWDEASPAAGDPANQAHIDIQNVKKSVRERMAVEHNASAGNDTDTYTHQENTAKIGQGVAASRPAAATSTKGHVYYSTDSKALELDNGSTWTDLLGAVLKLAGGTMTGALAMGSNKVTGLGTATEAGDALDYAHKSAATLDHPDSSVTTAKINNSAVTTDKLNANAVTVAKMATGTGIPLITLGTYTGDGSTPRTIAAGVDLSSGSYIIGVMRTDGNRRLVLRLSNMTATYSLVISDDWRTDCIISGVATGFTIGNRDDVNANTKTFYYFIMKLL